MSFGGLWQAAGGHLRPWRTDFTLVAFAAITFTLEVGCGSLNVVTRFTGCREADGRESGNAETGHSEEPGAFGRKFFANRAVAQMAGHAR